MKDKKIFFLLLWCISPLFLLIEGLGQKKPQLRKYALILLSVAFGFTIVLTVGDGYRHVATVENYYLNMPFRTYLNILFDLLTFKGSSIGIKDVFLHTLSYISGTLLGYPRALHIIVSFIYGYFFISSLMIMLKDYSKTPKSIVFIFLTLMLIFTKNLDGIQSLRNWTACWMVIYAFLMYSETRKNKFFILIALSPFIHFSYIIIAFPIIIIMCFKIRPLAYLIIFILSTFTSIIEPEAVKNIGLNDFFNQQINAYYDDENMGATDQYEQKTQSGVSIHRAFSTSNMHRIPTLILTGLTFMIVGIGRNTSLSKKAQDVFYAGVLMLSLSNFSWFLTSLSNRTLIISMILLLGAVCILYQENYRNIRDTPIFNISLFSILVLYIPYMYYSVSVLMMFTSVCMLIFPPFVLFFPEDNLSIKSLFTK